MFLAPQYRAAKGILATRQDVDSHNMMSSTIAIICASALPRRPGGTMATNKAAAVVLLQDLPIVSEKSSE